MIKIKKLNCGSTLITEQTDYVQSAAIGIWVKTGAINESDEISGISHFIEHMMYKGTETRSARDIANDFEKIGGLFNAATGKETTCFYVKTLSSYIYEATDILIDIVTNSKFDQEELDKERQVILEEIKTVNDTPDDIIFDTISELVNNGSPLRRSILGTPESLAKINRPEIVDYYSKRYSRDNIVIAVTGNFDEGKIEEIFEEKFLSINEHAPEMTFEIGPYERGFDVDVRDIEQTNICLAVPGISMIDDKYYAFSLMNNIFGASMSSRLFQKIREEKGLAYTVASMNMFYSNSGFFNIFAGVAHDKIEEAIACIKDELKKLVEYGVTDDELAMAKVQMKSLYIFSKENINNRMMALGKNKLLYDRVFTPEEVMKGFDSVTREDILEAASMIGDWSKYSGAAVTGRDFDLKGLIENDN